MLWNSNRGKLDHVSKQYLQHCKHRQVLILMIKMTQHLKSIYRKSKAFWICRSINYKEVTHKKTHGDFATPLFICNKSTRSYKCIVVTLLSFKKISPINHHLFACFTGTLIIDAHNRIPEILKKPECFLESWRNRLKCIQYSCTVKYTLLGAEVA